VRIRHPRRVALAIVGAFVFFAVAVFLVLRSTVPFSSDVARTRIEAVLADRLDSDVELQDLKLRLLPQLRVEGFGLKIRHKGRRDVPPLISIAHFTAEGDLSNLLRRHVSRLTVDGLEIQIPPDRNRDGEPPSSETTAERPPARPPDSPAQPRAESGAGADTVRSLVVDEMISTDSRLIIIPREAGKRAKVWVIHRLRMRNLGVDQAMPFEALLTNAVPPGEIQTSGSFGPWQADEPGQTPLDGKFQFDRADLGFFKGISGILSAHGTFGGTLARLDIHGETDTPEFAVTAAGNPVPLHATYHAIVDGTNGNTILDPVNGSFLNTSLVARGGVIDTPGDAGRTVTLDVTMERARLEDVLKLAVKSSKPPMTGALRLKTKFVLPPGDVDVVKKLQLAGQFAIAGTRFTDPGVQKKINELSRRSQGNAAEPELERVASQFNGTFRLGGGLLKIPTVTFDVPGALVDLSGSYDLVAENLNFGGTLTMDATISQMTTGFKSKLLKIVDPLFEKKGGGGSEIPLKITGSRKNPSFGLDKGRFFKRRGDTPTPTKRRGEDAPPAKQKG
jgi:hypothetical protein